MNTMAHLSTPNKRKLSEERDDDNIVTPSSSYDSDSDDNARDSDAFLSTPCPSFESPLKRRRKSMAVHNGLWQLSPPLMPRINYRSSSLLSHEFGRLDSFVSSGRPILDLFESNNNEQSGNDLSFLAIPTPPSHSSNMNKESIPTFGLSPRTTLAPRFPELHDSHWLFGVHTEKEKENEHSSSSSSRRLLPSLRMRRSNAPKHYLGNKELMEELSLPTLANITIQESKHERRSSLPAVAA